MASDKFAAWTRVKPSVFDVSGTERDVIVLYGYILDGRLDLDALRQAWQKLCQTWPVLVARLRKGADSKAASEWHYLLPPDAQVQEVVAADMSDSRPASHRSLLLEEVESKIRDLHPFVEGRELPQDRLTIHPTGRVIDTKPKTRSKLTQMFASNAPLTIGHLFTDDRPMVTAKVTRFTDATAIGISLPHVLCDGPGACEVMKAWAALANGDDAKVGPLPQFGEDSFTPLAPGGKLAEDEATALAQSGKKTLTAPFGWYAYSLTETISFGMRFAWDLFWQRPESTIEFRDMFLPKKYLEEQKAAAMAEIKSKPGAGEQDYVSTSDICVALTLKRMCTPDVRGPNDKRIVSFLYPANLRWLPGAADSVPLPDPYLHNGAYTISLPELPIGKIVHGMSVAELALEIRHAIQRDTQPEAIRRGLIWRLANAHKLLLFFRPSNFWLVGTNWRAMNLFGLSFEKALDQSAPESGTGRCRKLWAQTISEVPIRNSFGLVGDDPAGGTWVGMALSTSQWKKIVH
ncbi:hypothetical protein OC844_004658 [Tilletia horrida]|nr:hypothetical protein OC844_004658 [Tilletia horrida]